MGETELGGRSQYFIGAEEWDFCDTRRTGGPAWVVKQGGQPGMSAEFAVEGC